ncbi:cytochrome P450 87A3-like [Populus alba x Populus x berolinensis]|nr:cytochrome P450 87A3-like [Populus alba x Populus x berolinensis]
MFEQIFRTNILGRPAVVTADPEINNYIFQNEGKLVEMWYLDSFSKLLAQSGESRTNAFGIIHKYARSLTLTHFGSESLKERLLPEVENIVSKSLQMWSSNGSIDVKTAVSIMVCDFTAKQLFSYGAENSSGKISEKFKKVIDAFICLPLNIPGTTYHKCLKERMSSPAESRQGDFLDQVIADMDKEKFLTEDFIVNLIFGILFASFESISTALIIGCRLLMAFGIWILIGGI